MAALSCLVSLVASGRQYNFDDPRECALADATLTGDR